MGVLFAAGSVMFLVPSLAATGSSADWIGITFVAGSVCFTSASLIQLITAAELPHRLRPRAQRRPLRPRAWLPATADWLSAAIQFPGTILFNVNTVAALNDALTTHQMNVRVWVPDMLGSLCFLLSSLLGFANAGHRWVSWRPRDLDWWIPLANLLGSLAFGVAALAAYVSPATSRAVNDALANGGTAVGALCFLAGAIMLLPQAERAERSNVQ
jgi:hypothetical protein